MSEEEILKECTELAENEHHELGDCWDEEYSSSAIFGLIMLYKQTKKSEEVLANKLQEVNIELDKYKRLAEMNLKDSEEFRENMCEHRCILNNQIMELTEEINNLKEIEKFHKEENGELRVELEQEKEKNNDLETDYILCAMDRKNHYVSKDKIKEKIEETNNEKLNYSEDEYYLENEIKGYAIDKLKELLEEK